MKRTEWTRKLARDELYQCVRDETVITTHTLNRWLRKAKRLYRVSSTSEILYLADDLARDISEAL